MLNVQGRVDVDPLREDLFHIEVALRMAASVHIGVRQLVDEYKLRAAIENGVDIHFFQGLSPILHLAARYDLEPVDERLGLLAAMCLDDADHDVDAVCLSRVARDQHLVGLADARRGTEKDLQTAAPFALGILEEGIR
jgi:hypothetical protein